MRRLGEFFSTCCVIIVLVQLATGAWLVGTGLFGQAEAEACLDFLLGAEPANETPPEVQLAADSRRRLRH